MAILDPHIYLSQDSSTSGNTYRLQILIPVAATYGNVAVNTVSNVAKKQVTIILENPTAVDPTYLPLSETLVKADSENSVEVIVIERTASGDQPARRAEMFYADAEVRALDTMIPLVHLTKYSITGVYHLSILIPVSGHQNKALDYTPPEPGATVHAVSYEIENGSSTNPLSDTVAPTLSPGHSITIEVKKGRGKGGRSVCHEGFSDVKEFPIDPSDTTA